MTVSRAWITPSLRRRERETMLKGWYNGLLKLKFKKAEDYHLRIITPRVLFKDDSLLS